MSLVGVYKNDHSGGVIEITTVDDIKGQGSGNFTMGDACISVTFDYDLMNEGGTTILFSRCIFDVLPYKTKCIYGQATI